MHTRHDAIVIGAGQAGLAASWWLTRHGVGHVVLDRGRVADRWRTQRWDTFRLLSPNWQTRLPGYTYSGRDPDGFMTGAEVADFLRDYARSFAAPVRERRRRRRAAPRRRRLAGRDHRRDAGSPTTSSSPPASYRGAERPVDLRSRCRQLHTSAYRNAAQLPPGAVLVVGAGPSGQQIARELAEAGRRVHLAVGRHKALPRRYRGRDTYWWMDRLGMLSRPVSRCRAAGAAPRPERGARRRHPRPRRAGARAGGVVVHGRLLGVAADGRCSATASPRPWRPPRTTPCRFRATVDAHVAATGLAAPSEAAAGRAARSWRAPRELDLGGGARRSSGRPASAATSRWIDAPLLGDDGRAAARPRGHRRTRAVPPGPALAVTGAPRASSTAWRRTRST